MEKTEETTKPNVSKTLLVRHLPAEMSKDEKEDMLKYFGAEFVRVFPSRGRMKNVAFATFRTENIAAKALSRLHQLQILGHTLVVEFAKGEDSAVELKDPPLTKISDKTTSEQKKEPKQQTIRFLEDDIAPNLGLKFQANPTLKYLYPPPSNTILVNIMHALISVPKFYVQVLHLMNKMNLPCPFGPVTARPPLCPVLQPSDVFEQPHPTGPKKIEFHISVSETKVGWSRCGVPEEEVEVPRASEAAEVVEGFGKLFPAHSRLKHKKKTVKKRMCPKMYFTEGAGERTAIERRQPTCRLYVKNIAKQVEEKVGSFLLLDPLLQKPVLLCVSVYLCCRI
ncbi:hypothetical protein WMY93_030048 [Mugilogobius chulae]|uniref:RNA-binding region-containing protein 3 n=1 Tax=Mugilogobius chulae TaxID=88201 RepID=A0AAW0MUR3_9GOBI